MTIEERMTPEERKDYEHLRHVGYQAHKEAHAIFMLAVDRWQAEKSNPHKQTP